MSEFDVVELAAGDRLLLQREVAERLRTTQAFVKKLLDTKLLPCIRFGRQARVSLYCFNEFIKKYQGEDLCSLVENAEQQKAAYDLTASV